MLKQYDQGYKIIIAGSTGVGKSCLLLRFVDNIFSTNTISTIGVDFKFKTMDINGTTVKMQIWDTAGSQNFRSIVSAYYRGANAVVLVFKIDDILTFKQLGQFWINQVNKYKEPQCQIMLIANQCDIQQNRIPEQQIKKFMEQNSIQLFFQTSAKTGTNVGDAFKQLGKRLLEKSKKQRRLIKQQHKHVRLSIGDPYQDENKNNKKSKCCK